MKLVDLSKVVGKQTVEKFQNRKVCNVTQYYMSTACCGRYKAWVGSTETEYFSIIFIAGFLSISITERECYLGQDTQRFATVPSLLKAIHITDDVKMEKTVLEYAAKRFQKDLDKITFQDVMDVLKWELLSDKVKVDIDAFHL